MTVEMGHCQTRIQVEFAGTAVIVEAVGDVAALPAPMACTVGGKTTREYQRNKLSISPERAAARARSGVDRETFGT